MKTIITTLLILVITPFTYSQITVNERPIKNTFFSEKATKKDQSYFLNLNNTSQTTKERVNEKLKTLNIEIKDTAKIQLTQNEITELKKIDAAIANQITTVAVKPYILNLAKFNKAASSESKTSVNAKLTALKIDSSKPENIELTKEQATALKEANKDLEKAITPNEEAIKRNQFYYEYFEEKLAEAKTGLSLKETRKKTIRDNFEELNALEEEISENKAQLDKYKQIIRDLDNDRYLQSKEDKWMPSFEPEKREDFFNSLYSKDPDKNNYLLNNVSAQLGRNSAAISSELLASYIKYVRVSFGTLITNADEDNETTETASKAEGEIETDETNAFQRLLSSGGGNLYMNFELPIYYLQSSTSTLYFNSGARLGVVLDQFSNDVDTATGNGNLGFNFYGSLSTDDKKSFIFFLNSNFGGYGGGTDFYKQLNLSKNGIFAFGQATVGVDIARSIRVSYTIGTIGSDENLRSTRGVIGIQLLKGLFDND